MPHSVVVATGASTGRWLRLLLGSVSVRALSRLNWLSHKDYSMLLARWLSMRCSTFATTATACDERLDVPMWEPSGEKTDLSDGKDKPETAATAADDTASDGGVAESKSNGDLQRQSSDDMDVGDASSELSQLLDELAAMDLTKLQLEPAGFEKDQDLNFHIDFVASASYSSKLRARNLVSALAMRTVYLNAY
eukprot:14347-Heterococcus_DN1.PRE.1